MINSGHIELCQFLDAREIVLERVQRHDNIKINTVFNGNLQVINVRIKVWARKTMNSFIYPICKNAWSSLSWHRWRNSRNDSGWTLSHILNLTVDKYNPLHVGCRIELLREIKIKKVIHWQFLSGYWLPFYIQLEVTQIGHLRITI